LIQSRSAADLVALDNPSSRIQLTVRVASSSVPRTFSREQQIGQRGILVVADGEAPRFRIRRGSEPRTPENSLQLEIRSSVDCYLSIVDVDSQGGVNLLFPTEHQRAGFYPQGMVRGGETVLLPDGLQTGNRGGFHWDYGPPPGIDTIRVFASTDLATAEMIRRSVREPQPPAQGTPGSFLAARSTVSRGALVKLREDLMSPSRGLIVVPDMDAMAAQSPLSGQSTTNRPGASETQTVYADQSPPIPPALASPQPPYNQSGQNSSPYAGQPGPNLSGNMEATPPYPAQPVADWTAVSVTIVVAQ
jgi:hypothetical protein